MVRTWKNSSETHDSDGSQALVMIRSSVVAVAICGRLLLFSFLFLSYVCVLFFFFSSRRRHTRLTCDWSSDVCSSDLSASPRLPNSCGRRSTSRSSAMSTTFHSIATEAGEPPLNRSAPEQFAELLAEYEIGRASCRERV